ncbi:hypothetical protein [Lignipirellula cremea]|uniref:Cytochrome c domain-containing protein n=1 Tax=Lignipirellula cremea TaxID=2528010 RepID=A0A518E4T7_9BACT|nr:hypothetical protein [Lignipirellula cremea]QDU99083.1 hypothetical protein Pla8534_69940 [Lignipirellula cremea]
MKNLMMSLICGAVVVACSASPAFALPAFKSLFADKYAPEGSDAAFQEAVKTAGCNACHVKGEPKSTRNAYGEAIAKEIPGDASDRIKEAADKDAEKEKVNAEFLEALKKVEDMKSASGQTYGEILKAHKLP